jgi:uncharacterized protein (UPF0335 family)
MFRVIRMVKRGDKLPAEFRQEWLERNRELRKTAGKLLASVIADGNILPGEPLYHGVASLYYPAVVEARAAHEKDIGKDAISVIAEERVLFEKSGATYKTMGQLKVILTDVRKKELTPAQFKDAASKVYAKIESKTMIDAGVQKMVVSFAQPEKGKEPAFDSMLELYFASADEIKSAFGSPVIGELRKEIEPFVDLNAPEIRMVVEESTL